MALSASTVLEVRTGGSDTNGGGFVTGASGTDWSLQNGTQYAVTDGVTAGTTTITSATAAFGTDVVGNLIYVQGGTGSVTAGWYQIITRTNATTIVVDRSTGLTAGTGVTLHIGGALLSPAVAASIATVAGMITYIKYTAGVPYSITSASTNIAAGCISGTSGTFYAGYDTTRALYTPYQNRPTIQLNVGTATMFGPINNNSSLQSVILDANSQTTSTCYASSGECLYVKAMNCTTNGFTQNIAQGLAILCEATGGNTSGAVFKMQTCYSCTAHNNTISSSNVGAFAIPAAGVALNCISYNNTKDGISLLANAIVINCVAYGNSQRGFYLGNVGTDIETIYNCISEANGAAGYFVNSGLGTLINCADYNNTGGRKNSATLWRADVGPITGSGSFFTAAGSNDFTLNNTAGAGALLIGAGFPPTLPV